jgi:adenylate cyclase
MTFNSPQLQFERLEEAHYRQSVAGSIVQILRIGGIAGVIAVPAFVTNDLMFDAEAVAKTLPVRLAVAVIIGSALIFFRLPRVTRSPHLIALITHGLFFSFSVAVVMIQARLTNGFLVNVPGYVQVMIFVPIVCFSFFQAFITTLTISITAIVGAQVLGATEVEVRNVVNWMIGSGAFALGAAFVVDRVRRRTYLLEKDLKEEKARSDALLLNVLPPRIAERLKNKEPLIADYCPNVTVLFADIVGFTAFSRNSGPTELVKLLNDLFSKFDDLVEKHRVEKIKTIGDGYMVVAGLTNYRNAAQAAKAMAELSLDMHFTFITFCMQRELNLSLRIGLHSGPVVAGVIGTRKFSFDLWGDTVNVASRIEAACPNGSILITRQTYDLIGPSFQATFLGNIEIRGHEAREAFLLNSRFSDCN